MKKLSNLLILLTLILLSVVLIQHFGLTKYVTSHFSTQEEAVQEEVETKEKIRTRISYAKHIEKGDSRFQNGYLTLAITEYSLASQLEPTLPEPYIKIGKVHFGEKDFTKALENFRIANQIDIKNIESKILIGITYISLSEFDKSEKIFNSIEGNDARIYYYRGLLGVLYKRYEDAKYNLEEVLKINPESQIADNAKRILNAFTTFEGSEGAQETYLRTLLAQNLSEINEHNLTIQVIYDVLEANPEYRDAWIILGYSYLNLEKYFDAISSLKEAEEIDPSKPETLYFLGLAEKKQGEYGESINHLEIALRNGFEPKEAVFKELAEGYLKNEEYEKSVQYYEKLIEVNPENLDAFIKAIWIYLDFIGDSNKATEIAESVVLSHPDSALSYNLLGWALAEEGDVEGSKENLDKAIEMDENLAAAYLNLGIWYEVQDNLKEAKANYNRAYELEKGTAIGEKAMIRYNAIIKAEAAEEVTPNSTN
ncbi:tetratricopeptide repeat protein [Candidatus Peregrinibacteria bacterium]|jgi:tetratricopeptide (TPR) repeat protein|nr:tetratricopeptide repeat protein [Candidatus Peregrinibacteria bacterium]